MNKTMQKNLKKNRTHPKEGDDNGEEMQSRDGRQFSYSSL